MNLIHKKLLQLKITSFELPNNKFNQAKKLLEGWKKALKDSDLEKTKEKSVQGKFLSTFFEDILGYSDVTTGYEEWTLIQHPRIENDSREPDGSLGWFSRNEKLTRAVIELKDAKTQLDKKQYRGYEKLTPIEQAYLYATKYDGCNWIIVSNFKEIRIYNKHKTQEYFEKFDVTNLTEEEEFKRFYFLLSKDTLLSKGKDSLVDELTKNTLEVEQDITKKFYKEYRQIRLNLFNHLIENNSSINKEVLLEKAQKLLDRLIFTLFCEDTSSLLPLNIVKTTYERALNSLSPSDERVWSELKGLFTAIDKGNNRVMPPINAYNGGLFAPDNTLDMLSIKDNFWCDLMKLADYDFETDLNVNILGHIFEQSISDLETIKESIGLLTEGGDFLTTEDGNKIILEQKATKIIEKRGRRKKEGIFYTPEHITKYIVENSVGKYLEEHPDRLESIKILDPACGSGSILNQAHSFLINEYKIRHEDMIMKKLEKDESITLFDYNPAETNKEILLNNLYGVDLNQESVEISKLALWLKTARKTEPLQNLDKNIKCGNSLIDDPAVAGEKAFNWNTEYKQIMDQGGFDVIVGNPPYVNAKNSNFSIVEKEYWNKNFNSASYQLDTYILFIEKAINLLKDGGYLGYIIPNTWLGNIYLLKIRELLLKKTLVITLVEMPKAVFEDASVDTLILIAKKGSEEKNHKIEIGSLEDGFYVGKQKIEQSIFKTNEAFIFDININPVGRKLVKKMEEKSIPLNKIAKINRGVHAYRKDGYGKSKFQEGFQTERDYNEQSYHSNKQIDNTYQPEVRGNNLHRYFYSNSNKFISWGNWLAEPRDWDFFSGERVYLRKIVGTTLFACYTNTENVADQSVYIAKLNNNKYLTKYIVSLLNSKLLVWYFRNKNNEFDALFPQIKVTQFKELPIAQCSLSQQQIISNMGQRMLDLNKELNEKVQKALEILVSKYLPNAVSTALKTFYKLGWNELIVELEKQKVKVSLSNQEELQRWFDNKRSELLALDNKIRVLDEEIDQEVYKLYGLSEEEKKIVENLTI